MLTLTRLVVTVLLLFALPASAFSGPADGSSGYRRIVLLGDPHLPGRYPEKKERVLAAINGWDDVDLVVALGDICQDRGTVEEYQAAQRFFSGLRKPFLPIPGNHDVGYDDAPGAHGKRTRASDDVRRAKLERFKNAFGLPAIHHSRRLGDYLLIFLATDGSGHLAELSSMQRSWLDAELTRHRDLPAIVFFHAPLADTLAPYNKKVNRPDYIAQPAEALAELTDRHPNLLLWVSGHTHTTPNEPSFASPGNRYRGRITAIHTTDLNRGHIWSRSLFLYRDRVVVGTWDHETGNWLPELEQSVPRPDVAGPAVPLSDLLPPLAGPLVRPFTANEAKASGHWKAGSTDLPHFGAERTPAGRRHAGVDLYPAAGAGAPVRAMADGLVLAAAPFYTRRNGEVTWGLLVDHERFVVNYGEIRPQRAAGERVLRGDLLGTVSGTAQLHLELYAPGQKRWIGGWYGPRPDWLLDPTELMLTLYPSAH